MSSSNSDPLADQPTPPPLTDKEIDAQNDNPVSSINNQDPNFIPIAYPIVDSDQQNIINPLKPRRRKFPPHLPPVFPPITLEQLHALLTDYDDYFTNPLVSHHVFAEDDIMVDELDRVIAGFNSMPPQPIDPMAQFEPQPHPAVSSLATTVQDLSDSSSSSIPSLLRPDVSKQTNVQFPNDPYNVPGKTVKHGDILVESVDVPQNANWAAGIDYYEEGRLIGFSVTCNDPDMVPTVFIESASSSQTIINNMSYREMVQHGRGMTYAAATSTINTPLGVVSRDVQGQPSSIFPYVARYKDQYTGSGVYDDVKDTPDDKAYVITYEPSTSIPYQRINFQVYNGSTLGTRMINKIEIRRLIYVDPEPSAPSTAIMPDMTKFTAAINSLGGKLGIQLPNMVALPMHSNYATATTTSSQSFHASGGGGNSSSNHEDMLNRMYDDFIKYMYHKRFGYGGRNGSNNENEPRVQFKQEDNNQEITSAQDQQTLVRLMDMVNNNSGDELGVPKDLMKRDKSNNIMNMNWEI